MLLHLSIEGLHGYIDKEVDFHDKITLLVGINGSGKTSILNLVNWLLEPSVVDLARNDFKKVELSFHWEGRVHAIICKKTQSALTLGIRDQKGPSEESVSFDMDFFRHRLANSTSEEAMEFARTFTTRGAAPESQQARSIWHTFDKIPKPFVIGLDRVVSKQTDPDMPQRIRLRKVPPGRSPMDWVKQLARTNFSKYRAEVIEASNRLKDAVLLTAFDVEALRPAPQGPANLHPLIPLCHIHSEAVAPAYVACPSGPIASR